MISIPTDYLPRSKTEELLDWIYRISNKKTNMRLQRQRNLRVEAILENAQYRAQAQLEASQKLRRARWQDLQSRKRPRLLPQREPVDFEDETICDCEHCTLCQRHSPTTIGDAPAVLDRCYCNHIFSSKPLPPGLKATEDEESLNFDEFFSALNSCRPLAAKRQKVCYNHVDSPGLAAA